MGHGRGTHTASYNIQYRCECGISKQFVLEKQMIYFKKLHGKFCNFSNADDTRISQVTFNLAKNKVVSQHTIGIK